jgi:putative endonuclease
VKSKDWYVYIIESKSSKLYTGITTDVERRFEEHSSGKGAKFFRSDTPKKVVWSQSAKDRSRATKIEMAIKKLSKDKKKLLVRSKKSYESWSSQGD